MACVFCDGDLYTIACIPASSLMSAGENNVFIKTEFNECHNFMQA